LLNLREKRRGSWDTKPTDLVYFGYECLTPFIIRALIIENLHSYPNSSIIEIYDRITLEIKRRRLKTALDHLATEGKVRPEGEKRWWRYWIQV